MRKRLVTLILLELFLFQIIALSSSTTYVSALSTTNLFDGLDAVITGENALSSTYAAGIFDFDIWDLRALCDSIGVGYNLDGYSAAIEEYFLPLNIRAVGFQSFNPWEEHATTPYDTIPFSESIDTVLTAFDKYGISFFLVIPGGQWGASAEPPSWDYSVITAYPELQTYDRDGNLKQPGGKACVVIDHPLLLEQFKRDVTRLYELYGHHSSWVGFYNGLPGGDHARYVGTTSDNIVNTGYSPYTMRNYVNSPYFARIVDMDTGLLPDGNRSKLYDTFYATKSLMSYGYGILQEVERSKVCQGSSGYVVCVEFRAPENLDGFQVVWYGGKYSGGGSTPGPLKAALYTSTGELPDLASPLETVDVTVLGENTVDWQPAIPFASNIAEGGSYWIVFTAEGGDENNFYDVRRRRFQVDPGDGRTLAYDIGYGEWLQGSPILKIQDNLGVDKLILPWRQFNGRGLNFGNIDQYFTPTEELTVNYVFLLITDKEFDDSVHTVDIIRASDMQILASGPLDQSFLQGLYQWMPIPLNQRITLSAGEEYIIRLESAPLNPNDPEHEQRVWEWHGIITDPPEEGFEGESKTFGFKLADMNLPIINFQYVGPWLRCGDEHGVPPISTSTWYATRFKPTQTAKLTLIDVYIYKTGTSALTIELWEGSDSPQTLKESKTVAVASTGYLPITGWNTSVTADTYYWIIFKGATGEVGRLRRTVNPWRFGVWASQDNGATWFHPDISDPSLWVETELEKWHAEPDDMSADTWIKSGTPIAQSITPETDIVAKGVLWWMDTTGNVPASSIFVEVRTDDGGIPSATVLTRGTFTGSLFDKVTQGLNYVDFDIPVSLSSGTKYWLVFASTDPNSAPQIPIYYFRNPSDSYGGTDDKALYFRDGSWRQLTSKELGRTEGDIIFAIAEPPYSTTTYSIPELAAEIETYHYKDNRDDPLAGWNTYLNLWSTRHFNDILELFEGYTGKPWVGLDINTWKMIQEVGGEGRIYTYEAVTGPLPNQGPPSDEQLRDDVLRKVRELLVHGGIGLLPEGSLGHSQDNTGAITSEQIGWYYRATVPILARGIHMFDVDSSHLTNDTLQTWSKNYGNILSRMRYFGGYYGHEKQALKALFLGDMDIGIAPQFFTSAIDVTLEGFMGFSGDYNLTKYGDFKQFDVIVGFSGRPGLSQLSTDAQERIKAFVSNGGGLVCFGGYPSWANEIFAGAQTIAVDHVINSPYAESDFVDLRPEISVSSYGSGRGVVMQLKRSWWKVGTDPDTPGAPRDSILVLVTNSLFYAGGKESLIPAWWYPQYRDFQTWHKEVWYSICGKPGSPVLLWLSNNGESTEFEIHLNSIFYGIDSTGWLAIDAQNWEVVAKGSGTDIKIATTIPAESWKPIYIMNATSDLNALYSNIFVEGQSISTGEAHYTLQGPYKQTSWLLVRSTNQPTGVSVNNTGTLPKLPLDDLLSDSTPNGWHYDSTNEILYVKFHPTSAVEITAFVSTEQLPDLFVDVTLNPSTVSSEGEVSVGVHVADQTGPVDNAYVQLTSDNGGNFSSSSGSTDSSGDFSSTFSAPNVSQQTSVRITVIVSKSGYIDGVDYEYLTVLPPGASLLYVTVSADPSEIQSSETSTITVHVTDGVNPVSGAAISLLSDMGGAFAAQDGITDSNGDFSTIFTAPSASQQTTCTLTANATKSGYYDGHGEVQISVASGPEGNGGTETPWVLYLTATLVVVSAVAVMVVLAKRPSKLGFRH